MHTNSLKKPATCCLLSLSLTEGSRSVIPGECGTVLAKVPGDTGEHNRQHLTCLHPQNGDAQPVRALLRDAGPQLRAEQGEKPPKPTPLQCSW